MLTLDGITAKLARAEEEINELTKELSSFCEGQRRNTRMVEYPESKRINLEFHGPTPVIPLSYSIQIGEIAYNLRSALDHLVWQLVLANYKEPSRSNEFPILRDEMAYNRAIKRKLAGVRSHIQAKIRQVQRPFKTMQSGLRSMRCS